MIHLILHPTIDNHHFLLHYSFSLLRLFVKNRCLGCCEKIAPGEYVMRALDNVFHLNCFVCVVCGVKLQKGEQYVIKQSQLFCRMDYEKEVEMLQCANGKNYKMRSGRYITSL